MFIPSYLPYAFTPLSNPYATVLQDQPVISCYPFVLNFYFNVSQLLPKLPYLQHLIDRKLSNAHVSNCCFGGLLGERIGMKLSFYLI